MKSLSNIFITRSLFILPSCQNRHRTSSPGHFLFYRPVRTVTGHHQDEGKHFCFHLLLYTSTFIILYVKVIIFLIFFVEYSHFDTYYLYPMCCIFIAFPGLIVCCLCACDLQLSIGSIFFLAICKLTLPTPECVHSHNKYHTDHCPLTRCRNRYRFLMLP